MFLELYASRGLEMVKEWTCPLTKGNIIQGGARLYIYALYKQTHHYLLILYFLEIVIVLFILLF